VPDSVLIRVRRSARRYLGATGTIAVLALLVASSAHARSFRPPHHRIFHGVSDTGHVADYRTFKHRVRAHSALLEDFYHWDTPLTTGALDRWDATDTRGVLSLSTAPGGQPEMISPRKIAKGHGDDYILRLNQSIAASRQVVYLRLFPEMNGNWNPYSAYNSDGSYRGPSHSTHSFRKAWRRVVIIVRGGKRRAINRALVDHGMPRMYRASTNHGRVYARKDVPHVLPRPKVAFMWVPQTTGSPNVPGNQPSDYWPGARYVDWVGIDIYSAYASAAIPAMKSFYRRWHRWPFVVGEYSPWDNDQSGRFTRRLFRWAERSRRVRALIYYRSVSPGNAFDISHWPKARSVIRHHLNKRRWDPYARGTRD
jgi:hypothetical protein